MSKIILLSDSSSITMQIGSKMDTVTSRDSLAIKVHKYLDYSKVESVLANEKTYKNFEQVNTLVVFNESEVNDEEIIKFCKRKNCSLLILKEEFNFNGSYDFKIIHSPLIKSFEEICKKIFE